MAGKAIDWLKTHLKKEPWAFGSLVVAGVALLFAYSSLQQAKSSSDRASHQTDREALTRLVAEIVTLRAQQPTAGQEEAELAAAEVAFPLADELRRSTPPPPPIDFYEIGSALAMDLEAPNALRALNIAAEGPVVSRARAFALREEASLLYKRGEAKYAEADIYKAKHLFDHRGERGLIELDRATSDLFDAAQPRPGLCHRAPQEIADARNLMSAMPLSENSSLADRLTEATAVSKRECH